MRILIKKYNQIIVGFVLGLIIGTIAALVIGVLTYRRQAIETSQVLRVIQKEQLFPGNLSDKLPVIWTGFTREKVAALTFDDGPDPRYTAKILDILKREKIKASFFVTGENALAYPRLIRRERKEGHLIGNHTFHHVLLLFASDKEIRDELISNERSLKKIGVKIDKYFRPPFGATSNNVLSTANNNGYQIILWSAEMRERRFPLPYDNAEAVADIVQPGGIILSHDGGLDHDNALKSLPILIKKLKERGYRFVRVDKLPFDRTVKPTVRMVRKETTNDFRPAREIKTGQ